MAPCLRHTSGGKPTERALFSSASVFCMDFSHACVSPLPGGTAPPVEATISSWSVRQLRSETTEPCQLNLGSRLPITANVLGGGQWFPPSHSGPRLPLQACESGRQRLVNKGIFLVRSQDKARRGCAQQAWSHPSPKSPWLYPEQEPCWWHFPISVLTARVI